VRIPARYALAARTSKKLQVNSYYGRDTTVEQQRESVLLATLARSSSADGLASRRAALESYPAPGVNVWR